MLGFFLIPLTFNDPGWDHVFIIRDKSHIKAV